MDVDCLAETASKYKMTPIIATLSGKDRLTQVDIDQIVERGIRILTFRPAHFTKDEMLLYQNMIELATKHYCEKNNLSVWPVAIAIDIPNGVVRTGMLDASTNGIKIKLEENTEIEFTTKKKYWNHCTSERIFIDAPFTFDNVKVGTDITLEGEHVYLQVTQILDNARLKCKVIQGGYLNNTHLVFIRGIGYSAPIIQKKDLGLIQFVKECKADIIIVHFLREEKCVKKVKNLLLPHKPLLLATVCDEMSLINFENIIKIVDGIIISREYLSGLLPDKFKLSAIQLNIGAKCKAFGKPCFVSGKVFNDTLTKGKTSCRDILDATSIVLQGLSLVLKNYKEPEYVVTAAEKIEELCHFVEPKCEAYNDFWRIMTELKIPVNAADACAVSAALAVLCSQSTAVVLPSVTGKTAILLTKLVPKVPVITVTTKCSVARRLLVYRGILPFIYEATEEGKNMNWADTMWSRVHSAVMFACERDILKSGQTYVLLRKSGPTSSYCDQVSVCAVDPADKQSKSIICDG